MIKDLFEKLKFSTYVIFHPFKGFWELKKEKKGKAVKIIVSLLAVAVVVCIAVLLLNGCAKPTSEMSF